MADLRKTKFYYANMQNAHLVQTKLQNADLSWARLQGIDFTGAYFDSADLHGAEFNSDTNFGKVHWGNYILGEEKKGLLTLAEETYRRLKIWYTNAGTYDIAGKFFYREMEAKRKAQSWKSEPASKLWSWVMRLLCGYGERYGNVVVAALVIIFGLAVVYGFGGLNLAYAIYFSAVSFTALGYGSWVSITPEGWVRALGAAESFLGVFMMALFLVTFVRKMTR